LRPDYIYADMQQILEQKSWRWYENFRWV
jgi:hypothetical protein